MIGIDAAISTLEKRLGAPFILESSKDSSGCWLFCARTREHSRMANTPSAAVSALIDAVESLETTRRAFEKPFHRP